MNKLLLTILLALSTSLVYARSKKASSLAKSKPFVLGVTDQLPSKVLGEQRTLNIYLPEGYNEQDSIHYPVIYLLDGSADEDFIHITGLVQFSSFEWINQVPKSIVVGIATVDRRRDFTFPTSLQHDLEKAPTSGKSDRFMAFIEQELQPYIQQKYKVNQTRTLIGQSLGGLFATQVLFKKPTLFNKYIIISPSLWWNNGSLLNEAPTILSEGFTQETAIYIGVGKEGLTPTAVPRVMEVDANVLADKIRSTKSQAIKVYFDYLPQEDHATIMHQAVSNAFKVIYKVPVH